MTQRESQGPDPCHGSVRCKDFHDPAGRKPATAGTGTLLDTEVEALGGIYNCCCCDPCRYVRLELVTDEEDERYYCCRCVPRVLMLLFTPDDPEAECCISAGVPMFQQQGTAGYTTYYHGVLFGVTVEVELGRVVGEGAANEKGCGWKVTQTIGAGSGSADVQTFEIDHSTTSCLFVPEAIELATVEGPNGCTGYLSLADVGKYRLPFLERLETSGWTGPNFIDISNNPAGPCTEVCSKICVTGQRHVPGSVERREFTWFDETTGTGSTGQRGWEYENSSGYTERLLLSQDESGNCVITPELESGVEKFNPVTVDSTTKCSCKLKEDFETDLIGGQTYSFTIRCGFCSCWEFVCGTCRCVPAELCIVLYDGTTMQSDLVAVWNETDRSWDVANTGTGTEPYLLRLFLRDDDGTCVIEPELHGETVTLSQAAVFDCGAESVTGQFTGASDIVTLSMQGTYDGPNGTGSNIPVVIIASSLMPGCIRSSCEEATPCRDECGGHPAQITLNLHWWSLPGDTSGSPIDCETDLVLHFWQSLSYIYFGNNAEPIYACGYVGYLYTCLGVYVKYKVRGPTVYIGVTNTVELTTMSCNPYYAQSDVMLGVGGPYPCFGCTEEGYRFQITITE